MLSFQERSKRKYYNDDILISIIRENKISILNIAFQCITKFIARSGNSGGRTSFPSQDSANTGSRPLNDNGFVFFTLTLSSWPQPPLSILSFLFSLFPPTLSLSPFLSINVSLPLSVFLSLLPTIYLYLSPSLSNSSLTPSFSPSLYLSTTLLPSPSLSPLLLPSPLPQMLFFLCIFSLPLRLLPS